MIDRVVDGIGRTVAWLNLGMVVVTCVVVVLRYAFDTGAIYLQESVVYMHGAAFLCGLAYALQHDAHVRVDLLYSRMPEIRKAIVNLVGHVVLLMPLCTTIVIVSWPYAAESWAVLEGSPEVAGIPAVFLLKTLIPVSAFLLLLQAASLAVGEAVTLRRARAGHG
ncbi:MAG: TRAP transporter small permease subunit [Chloroflexi bacterium]|nr:TRAP transporter small permease subunit [Chloroflexota bacterium]